MLATVVLGPLYSRKARFFKQDPETTLANNASQRPGAPSLATLLVLSKDYGNNFYIATTPY